MVQNNEEMKEAIDEEKWQAGKYNGIRLARVAEGNALICKKTKEQLELTEDQFQVFKDLCKANSPRVTFGPDEPEKPKVEPKRPVVEEKPTVKEEPVDEEAELEKKRS